MAASAVDPCFVSFRADAYDSILLNGLQARSFSFIRAAKTRLEAKLAFERWRPSSDQNKMRIVAVSTGNAFCSTPYENGLKLQTRQVPPQYLSEFYDGNAVGADLLLDAGSKDVLFDVPERVVYMAVSKHEEHEVGQVVVCGSV